MLCSYMEYTIGGLLKNTASMQACAEVKLWMDK